MGGNCSKLTPEATQVKKMKSLYQKEVLVLTLFLPLVCVEPGSSTSTKKGGACLRISFS